jgi:molecular chaperone DnaK
MSKKIAVDFGTTNTVISIWNDKSHMPDILHLSSICRSQSSNKAIDDSYTIPSCVYLNIPNNKYPFPLNFIYSSRKKRTVAEIGSRALALADINYFSEFICGFKSELSNNSYKIVGGLDDVNFTAAEITQLFFKSLIQKIKKVHDISAITITTPVDSYEFYKATLKKIIQKLGVRKVSFIDEPLAAALGYGLSIEGRQTILVIDFGGGTLDIALAETEQSSSKNGKLHVISKEGVELGGRTIDAWIVEDACEKLSYDFTEFEKDTQLKWWYNMLLREACRVKEELYLKQKVTFNLLPSVLMKKYLLKISGMKNTQELLEYTRSDLINLLDKRKLMVTTNNLISSVLKDYIPESEISDVLLIGGSTLLPDYYKEIEKRFGRGRVHAWQPFNAVAFGASVYSAKAFVYSDHITHDYALLTYNKKTLKEEYTVIIPRGTRYPTEDHFWRRQLSPTCANGLPETIFKLMVFEIGTRHSAGQEVVYLESGQVKIIDENTPDLFVSCLNRDDPVLGVLNPAHYPSEKIPRVEVSFMIDDEKWLCVNVIDLKSRKELMKNTKVVRLK